jgi:enolase
MLSFLNVCITTYMGNKLAFQEFIILPTGAESFAHSVQIGCEARLIRWCFSAPTCEFFK